MLLFTKIVRDRFELLEKVLDLFLDIGVSRKLSEMLDLAAFALADSHALLVEAEGVGDFISLRLRSLVTFRKVHYIR